MACLLLVFSYSCCAVRALPAGLLAVVLFPPRGEEKKEPEQRQERCVPGKNCAARAVAHRALIVLQARHSERRSRIEAMAQRRLEDFVPPPELFAARNDYAKV